MLRNTRKESASGASDFHAYIRLVRGAWKQGTAQVGTVQFVTAMVIPVRPCSLPKAEFYHEINYHVNHLLINNRLGLR